MDFLARSSLFGLDTGRFDLQTLSLWHCLFCVPVCATNHAPQFSLSKRTSSRFLTHKKAMGFEPTGDHFPSLKPSPSPAISQIIPPACPCHVGPEGLEQALQSSMSSTGPSRVERPAEGSDHFAAMAAAVGNSDWGC